MSNFICESCLKVQDDLHHMCTEHEHVKICRELGQTYAMKNMAYGDAFGKTFQSMGAISAAVRMADKMSRINSLIVNCQLGSNDESLLDTLKDLANYCIMTVMEIQRWEAKNLTKPPVSG